MTVAIRDVPTSTQRRPLHYDDKKDTFLAKMYLSKENHMKQQCNISYVYGSWLILICGLIFHLFRGNYVQAGLWVFFIVICLWLYVRYFPSISRYMGYGSVEDLQPKNIRPVKTNVTLYTGLGCPFCPIVKKRLKELQLKMGFDLKEIDITLRPELLIQKGIRALPVVEVGKAHWVGNATSEQLATFITQNIFSS
jgi:glutaredoxin